MGATQHPERVLCAAFDDAPRVCTLHTRAYGIVCGTLLEVLSGIRLFFGGLSRLPQVILPSAIACPVDWFARHEYIKRSQALFPRITLFDALARRGRQI